MNKKWWAVVGLTAILVVAAFVLFLPWLSPNKLSIQFYKDGEPVGLPLTMVRLSPFRYGTVDVDGFTVTASWYTDNPVISYVEVPVSLKIVYPVSERGEEVVFDGWLWTATGSIGADGTGSRTSPIFALAVVAAGVPDDTAFTMVFTGTAQFYTGNPEHHTQQLVATVEATPAVVQLARTHYTYSASLDLPW